MAPTLELFCYGTLRPGQVAAGRLGDVARHAPATLVGHAMYDTGLGWPIAVEAGAGASIHGDLVWLDLAGRSEDDVLGALDDYEECDPGSPDRSLYRRVRLEVALVAGGAIEAWVYVSDLGRLAALLPAATPRHLGAGEWPPPSD